MLTILMYRVRDDFDEPVHSPNRNFIDPLSALSFLIETEFNFGTNVVSIQPEEIRLQTGLDGSSMIDHTIVTGTAEELEPIHQFIELYEASSERFHDLIIERIVDETDGNPRLLNFAGGMMQGRYRTAICILLANGIIEPDVIQNVIQNRPNDIIAALQLTREVDCSFAEAINLAS